MESVILPVAVAVARYASNSYSSVQKVRVAHTCTSTRSCKSGLKRVIHYLRMRSSENDRENCSGQKPDQLDRLLRPCNGKRNSVKMQPRKVTLKPHGAPKRLGGPETLPPFPPRWACLQWRSQDTADTRAQHGHTTFVGISVQNK